MDALIKSEWFKSEDSVWNAAFFHLHLTMSKDVNIIAPFKQSRDSSILGRLKVSLIVLKLSFLRLIQNLSELSFYILILPDWPMGSLTS